ncbi:MAG: hypothetical protein EA398_17585 [Deltaproteobacteria bacterium]|nr:MAG: hypothetical protein EA398_17585 [Deltaproteobacteria bacterium]
MHTNASQQHPGPDTMTRARALQQRTGLIDLHLDTLIQTHLFRYDPLRRHRPGVHGQPLFWHADLPRLEAAHYAGACLGIHGWPFESPARVRSAHRQIDLLDRWCAATPDRVVRWRPGEAWPDDGRIVLTFGIEGAHILGGQQRHIDALAERGMAYLTLAHFSRNRAVSPGMGRGANETEGLSPWGRDLIAILNERGVVVDVAHVNQRGAREACAASTRPVFATHTGSQRLHAHPRLLHPDTQQAVADTGGVIGVILAPQFLTGDRRADSRCVADHIEDIAENVGVHHVAIGTDLDGWLPAIPSDMRDCTDTVLVTAHLLHRGWTEHDVALVLRHNAVRVLTDTP